MYPRHSLVGLNHQALVDCQQTLLVCMAFDELCRPIEERGEQWRPDTVAMAPQRSITDWLLKSDQLDNSEGEMSGLPYACWCRLLTE